MATQTALASTLRTAARLGPERTVWSRLRARCDSFLAAGDISFERNYLIVRPAIAILVALSVVVQGGSVPGSEAVLVACGTALVLNCLYAGLMWKHRHHLMRAISLFADNGLVVIASLYVFHEMGEVGYESDLWLLYISLIVSNSLYYGPVGSFVFTTMWTSLFVIESEFFFDGSSYFAHQMITRLVFFVLTGFVSFSLAAELRKRRERLELKNRQTLSMLATIVEARDTDAGMHLRHIEHYSRALALRLGLDTRAANEVAYAAMIHDVGKAQVPDAILKKPGPLTTDERHEIEKHTLWGDSLLAESEEFNSAREVARHHHERWDGSGYPDGLAGEEIPLAARIVAVADVYDALISERPYKRAWPIEDAIAEIRKMSGGHFDPIIVDAFVHLHDTNVLRDLDAFMREDALSVHDHLTFAA
jgi:hypothetical protein